jgi:hypothetical protein
MAVREFVDGEGRQWKAWEVTPESVHPQTRAEDYLADCYRAGWIVFETADGENKRRLCPPPYAWHERDDVDLLALLDRAEVLRPKGGRRSPIPGLPADLPPSTPPEVAASIPRDQSGDVDMSKLNVVRSFHYPGGRVWAVGLVRFPEEGGEPVLRFVSGARSVDLTTWPAAWVDFTEERLIDLLRTGAPRSSAWREGMPTRRHGDPRTNPG